jgi:ankyrin repeat protein
MRALLSLLAILACLLRPAWAAPPTPLEFGVAIEAGNTWAAKKWLDEGLPPDFLADRIGSGLMIGAWIGNLEMMALFQARGADVNFMNRHGERALQLAAWRGHIEAVRWLLERGAEINRNDKQWGALHYAAFAGHADIARLLIGKGADVNARTPNDSTALMMAAREGQEDLARLLLEAGADTKPANEWGDTALAFAMRHKNFRIAKLVSPPEEFAKAVKAPPESFGKPVKSVPAPPEISDIMGKIRQAEAEGKPTDALRNALFASVALHRHDSEVQTLKTKKGKGGKPEVLVITAKRNEAGRERAELLYEAVKAGAAVTTPAAVAGRGEGPSEISGILERLQAEKGKKGKKRSAEELRRELHEAVAKFKREAAADAAK